MVWLGYLASQPQGCFCLCLPISEITSAGCHSQLSTWVLGWNSGLHTLVASTLPTAPSPKPDFLLIQLGHSCLVLPWIHQYSNHHTHAYVFRAVPFAWLRGSLAPT